MLIHRVTGVTVFSLPLVFIKSWLIIARGETATMGWSNPRLSPERGEDGLASFAFEADEPSGGVVAQVLTPIVVSTIFQPPASARGVRVRSASNEVVRAAPLYRAAGSGEEEEGDFDFIAYETEFNDLGYDAEDGDVLRRIGQRGDVTSGMECDRRRLFKVISRIEFKTQGLRLYRRERYLSTFLKFCFPTDLGDEAVAAIRRCLPAAIVAGIAGASGGPGGAVAAFVAALKGCVGAELGSKVTVGIDTDEEIGEWRRV